MVLQNGAEKTVSRTLREERMQRMEEIEEETGAGQVQKRKSSQLKFSHTNLN